MAKVRIGMAGTGDAAPLGRPVLIHYHIYKNAGSTIDRLLLDSFGNAFTAFEPAPDAPWVTPAELRRFLEENPSIKAVSSHRAHQPPPCPDALPIVMLRHPADRARSAWRFARSNPAMPDHEVATACDFAGYVRWSLGRRGHGSVLRDYQVTYLSQAARRQDGAGSHAADEADLAAACALIAGWRAIGLVRRFAESCRLFNARYRPAFPALRFMDTPENATEDTRLTEQQAMERARDELGDAAFSLLCDANRLDLALYDHASILFDHHLADIARPSRAIGWRIALIRTKARNRLSRPSLLARE